MQIFLEEDEDDKWYIGDDAAGEIELGCTLAAHLVEQLTGAELNTQLHRRLLLYNALRRALSYIQSSISVHITKIHFFELHFVLTQFLP